MGPGGSIGTMALDDTDVVCRAESLADCRDIAGIYGIYEGRAIYKIKALLNFRTGEM